MAPPRDPVWSCAGCLRGDAPTHAPRARTRTQVRAAHTRALALVYTQRMHAAARSYANACLVPCRGRCSPPDFAMRWMLPGLASHSRPARRFLPEARARAAQRRSPVSAADPARARRRRRCRARQVGRADWRPPLGRASSRFGTEACEAQAPCSPASSASSARRRLMS